MEKTQNQKPLNQKSKVLTNIPKWLPISILIIAIIGIGDAGYLLFEHLTGGVPNCTILEGCEVVTTSVYSEVFGIPVALFGVTYYISMAALMVLWFDKKNVIALKLAGYFSWAGIVASAWFVYLQLVILKAICIYCMGSAISSTLIFILAQTLLKKLKK
jgi:uncharacterized membrane protein